MEKTKTTVRKPGGFGKKNPLRRTNKHLEPQADELLKGPNTDQNMLRDKFSKAVDEIFPDLSAEKKLEIVKFAMREYSREAGRAKFLLLSSQQPRVPLKWSDAPVGMDLIEFLRLEYRDKGVIKREGFTRAAIKGSDPDLYDAIKSFCQRSVLPDDVNIPKAKGRMNALELGKTK